MPGLQEQKRICEIVADALKRGDGQRETVIATLTSVNQLTHASSQKPSGAS